MRPDQCFRYELFGMTVQSDIEMPQMRAARAEGTDLTIRRTRIADPLRGAEGAVSRFDGDKQYLGWDTVGGFRVVNETLIEVDPNPGVSDFLVALPLLGSVMATLLQRRGLLVLHASAAAVNGSGIGLLGDKGAGKSTTAGAIVAAGHALLSDDVVAIDFAEGAKVVPAYSQLKLWESAVNGIGLAALERQAQLHPSIEKSQFSLTEGFCDHPVPLANLYVLTRGEHAAILPLDPQSGLQALMRYSYMGRFGEAGFGGSIGAFFRRAAELANAGRVRILQVPHGVANIPDAITAIEADLGN
ncbi:serine kinase [Devosia sp. SL43]|uniref:serine kinase n=1 Tax=Devosia sp. SL43 TaxID=2806348 RepID=UPI001F3D7C20|nr:serine kinase [Devosia sp. SL43]UJW87444.1 serine kinase [Devosia sp. SL43]